MDEAALNARAYEWAERMAQIADEIESAALEWKLDRDTRSEIPMGVEAGAAIDPTIDYAILHAAVAMDMARRLRTVVADAKRVFGPRSDPGE